MNMNLNLLMTGTVPSPFPAGLPLDNAALAGSMAGASAPQTFAQLLTAQVTAASAAVPAAGLAAELAEHLSFQPEQLLLTAVRQALAELQGSASAGFKMEVTRDEAVGEPAATGQLPSAAGTPAVTQPTSTGSVEAEADTLLRLVWPRVAELVESALPVQLASPSDDLFRQLSALLHGATPGMPVAAPVSAQPVLSQPLVLPDGNVATLQLSPGAASPAGDPVYTARLLGSQGELLLEAKLTLSQQPAATPVAIPQSTSGSQLPASIPSGQSIPLTTADPARLTTTPVAVQQRPQALAGSNLPVPGPGATLPTSVFAALAPAAPVKAALPQLQVPSGGLTQLLAEQGLSHRSTGAPVLLTDSRVSVAQAVPARQAAQAPVVLPPVAAALQRSVALPSMSSTPGTAPPPEAAQASARAVAIPVPMPQGSDALLRQAALPDPASVLRPQVRPDTAHAATSGASASASFVDALNGEADAATQHSAASAKASGPASRLATLPQGSEPDSAFTALRRVGDVPETGPASVGLQWPDGSAITALGGGASTAGLNPRLLAFTQPGMQFLPSGLDYSALAQRVLSATDSARAAGNGIYEAKLELNPPQLGRMLANIAVRGEQVAVQLAVASSVPRRQLEEGLAGLKRSLEESGLEVTGLRVVRLDSEADNGGGGRSHERTPQRSTQQTARPWAAAIDNDFLTSFLSLGGSG